MSYREVTTGRTFPVLRDALDAQKWGRIPREATLEQDGHTNTVLRAGRVLTMGRKKRL